MAVREYGITDFRCIAAGAAILASGGGGSYKDAVSILDELSRSWSGKVMVADYDGRTNCCVLAMMGSPDAADNLTLTDVKRSVANTVSAFEKTAGMELGCVIPVEIGAINSIAPLIDAVMSGRWVVDGDGAGRAVPELPQTTYSGSLAASPCQLANDAANASDLQAAALSAPNAALTESLAGGIVSAFGSYSGIALWASDSGNGYALKDNYITGTLTQARDLGEFLLGAARPHSTREVCEKISDITGRRAEAVAANYYITAVTQSTTSASLDAGVIRLDDTPDQVASADTRYIYNLNENLIMYSTASSVPDVIAPDSICYYSESTGLGFSNATDDLAEYFDAKTGRSTGKAFSVIRVEAAPKFRNAAGVVDSFAGLLRNIGYAGALPYSG